MQELGPQDSVVLFAAHGTVHFNWDTNTMFLLPEYLHRLQFPQRRHMETVPLAPPTFGTDWWVMLPGPQVSEKAAQDLPLIRV